MSDNEFERKGVRLKKIAKMYNFINFATRITHMFYQIFVTHNILITNLLLYSTNIEVINQKFKISNKRSKLAYSDNHSKSERP